MGNLPDLAKECMASCILAILLWDNQPGSQDAVNVYDEALAQLLAQKEADAFRIQVQVVSQVTLIWHPQFWRQKAITHQQLDRNWKELWWSLMTQMDPNGQVSKDGI